MSDDHVGLPTPIARMCDRLERESYSDPMVQFESAWLLCEMLIKYLEAVVVSLLSRFEPERAHSAIAQLVRADGLAAWTATLARSADRLARLTEPSPRHWSRLVKQRVARAAQPEHHLVHLAEHVDHILQALGHLDPGTQSSPRPNLYECLTHLVIVRNKTRGHGAFSSPFYRQVAPHLAQAGGHLVDLVAGGAKLSMAATHSPSGETLGLLLDGASPTRMSPLSTSAEPGTLWLTFPGCDIMPSVPLMFIDPVDLDVSFVNGAWTESSLQVASLSYITGRTDRRVLPAYRGPATPLASATEGRSDLLWNDNIPHNLPPNPQDYVARLRLESRLHQLLQDRTHRLISLNGRGGSGKTTLALRVCHELVAQSSNFDCVAWVSGRDIDLLLEGPVPRERQVHGLTDFISFLLRVLGHERTDSPEVDVAATIGDGKSAYLIVVDNLETFDAPLELQRFLDDHVVLPSKVLITSRHERFVGDFPLRVTGMEDAEALELIRLESRRHYCEGRITEKVARQILDISEGVPYIVKLLVAQFSASGTVEEAYRRISSHEDLMEALFGRSFDLLSSDGQWLYLLLSQIEWAPEWLLSSLLALFGYGYSRAVDSLRAHSLVDIEDSPEEALRVVRVGHLLQRHGSHLLIGHELEPSITSAREFLRLAWRRSAVDPCASLEALWDAISKRRAVGTLTWSDIVSFGGAVSSHIPEASRLVANALNVCGEPEEEVRQAYKRAVEASPANGPAWRDFGDFERRYRPLTSALYGARAIDCGLESTDFALRVAADLSRELTDDRNGMRPAERGIYVAGVISFLERNRQRLDSTGLSRLGWLYFIQSAKDTDPERKFVAKAQECAAAGLALDATNRHCLQLLERATSSFR